MISVKSFYALEYKNLKERRKHFHLSVTEREKHLLCAKCNDILVEPQQTDCGCRFCLACITNEIQQCETLCPGCNDVVTSIKENIRYDRAVEKEIFELKMTCINEPCSETIKLRDLVVHLEKCDHRQNKCNACGILYLHNEMMKHERVTCQMLITKCKDCGREMRKKDLEAQHRNANGDLSLLCDNWRDICPYTCCEDTQDNIKTHLVTCVRMPVECDMKNIGCTKILPRIDMDEHIRSEVHHHMSLMMAEINKLNLDNAKIKSESFESNKKLSLEIDSLKKEVDNSSSEVRKLTDKLAICEDNYSNLMKEANKIKEKLRSDSPSSSTASSSSSSLYGEYTWKINNIVDKIKDAKNGINTQILSEPFYTDNPGYKMCLKMYPNGDGQRAGNFISLYFVIMKGDHDDEVVWPFNRKVSLSLLSTEAGVRNRTINMKPDINTSCYGKPTSAFNVAAGHPTFISHVELISSGEYIDKEAIKIQARLL